MPNSLRPYPGALLNPCADPTFKAIFTSSTVESKKALTEFLSDVIGKKITDLVLQPNELSVESYDDKRPEFDISCKIDDQYANIEIQGINTETAFDKRCEYHVAHMLNHYMVKGKSWSEVPKVYQISVLNFLYDKTNSRTVNKYRFRNDDGGFLSDRMNIIFIELPKIKRLPDDIEKLTNTEMWGKFFLYANDPYKKDFFSVLTHKKEGINMANVILANISENEVEWQREKHYWDRISDQKTIEQYYQQKHKQVEQQCRQIEQQCRQIEKQCKQAEQQRKKLEQQYKKIEQQYKTDCDNALEQGIDQTQKKIAKNLISTGSMSLEQIANITGLDVEKIEEIQKQMQQI